MKYFLCFLFLTFLIKFKSQAQNVDGQGIEANYLLGKMIRHSPKFIGPLPTYSQGYELCYVKKTTGKLNWEQRRKHPTWGWAMAFTNYGNDAVYGKCISLYPYLQLPIIKGSKIEWTLKFGGGIGYVSKRFERLPSWDTSNVVISSHVDNFTYFSTDLRYFINKHFEAQMGLNYSHISNAALKQPNLGINMYGAHVGVRYFPTHRLPQKIVNDDLPILKNNYSFQIRLGYAMKEAGFADGPIYPIYLVSGMMSKRYLSKNKIFAGIDYSFHQNIYAFLKNNEIFPGVEKQHAWKGAVFVGHEWQLGKASIIMQLGAYYHQAYLRSSFLYEKLGGSYALLKQEKGFLKEAHIYVLLKTHLSQAELAELGLGLSF